MCWLFKRICFPYLVFSHQYLNLELKLAADNSFPLPSKFPAVLRREIAARRRRREGGSIGIGAEDDIGQAKRMARKILLAELRKRKELKAKKNGSTSSKAFSTGFNLGNGADSSGGADGGHGFDEAADVLGMKPKPLPEVEEGEFSFGAGEDSTVSAVRGLGLTRSVTDATACDMPPIEGDRARVDEEGTTQRGGGDWDAAALAPAVGSMSDGDDDGDFDGDSEASSVQIPDDERDIDLDTVVHIPPNSRKEIFEKAKRQQRMRSRGEFMKVAGDPAAYSSTQLRNFLRSTSLNKKMREVGTKVARLQSDGLDDGVEGGERIASDARRRFVFVKHAKAAANSTADGGSTMTSTNIWCGGSVRKKSEGRENQSTSESDKKEEWPVRRRRLHSRTGSSSGCDNEDESDIFNDFDGNMNSVTTGAKANSVLSDNDRSIEGVFVAEGKGALESRPTQNVLITINDEDRGGFPSADSKQYGPSDDVKGRCSLLSIADGDSSDNEGGGFLPVETIGITSQQARVDDYSSIIAGRNVGSDSANSKGDISPQKDTKSPSGINSKEWSQPLNGSSLLLNRNKDKELDQLATQVMEDEIIARAIQAAEDEGEFCGAPLQPLSGVTMVNRVRIDSNHSPSVEIVGIMEDSDVGIDWEDGDEALGMGKKGGDYSLQKCKSSGSRQMDDPYRDVPGKGDYHGDENDKI